MLIREILDFAIDFVADRMSGSDTTTVVTALKLVLPQVLSMTNIDRFDEVARAHLQAGIDDALRTARLI